MDKKKQTKAGHCLKRVEYQHQTETGNQISQVGRSKIKKQTNNKN